MSIDTDPEFHEMIDRFARLDSLALRVQPDVVEIDLGEAGPLRIDAMTVHVTLNDEGAARRLATRHRLVPGPKQSELGLSRIWCGWLSDASRLLPVSVRVTLVSGG